MRRSHLLSQAREHRERVREHYEKGVHLTKAAMSYRTILAAYYNLLIPASASVLEVGCGAGDLLSQLNVASKCGVDLSENQVRLAQEKNPDAKFFVQAGEDLDLPEATFDYIIVSETINLAADVQRMFERLSTVSGPETRLIVNFYSSLWRPIVWLSTLMGLRNRQPESNWLSSEDVISLLHLTGWELIRNEPRIVCPVGILGFEQLLNRFLAPLIPAFCLCVFTIARRAPDARRNEKTISVVIPARNEAGNI